MTPEDFITKWEAADLKERSASHEHFLDLCRLLDVPSPAQADPTGQSYAFERGATKTNGGKGWADVWRRGHFAWEYKGRGKDFDKAFAQLQQYALALENPPLLIVSDLDRFRIHTNWTNTVSIVYEISLADLRRADKRQILRAALSNPDELRPNRTRQSLTEEAAGDFAQLAQRLRTRGIIPTDVAHFINRLVFCMFAEDVGLLPDRMFIRMLEQARERPHQFSSMAKALFSAMSKGGMVGFESVEWFNGGLFDNDAVVDLQKDEIDLTLRAARLDWAEIDPSILGTLFERGLDPSKRSQLGAHYTGYEMITKIIQPIIVSPLVEEWNKVKEELAEMLHRAKSAKSRSTQTKIERAAQSRYQGFLDRLRKFKVLDPACGSGNFLYSSLLALKDLEHRVMLEAEAVGFQREFPQVGPSSIHGIELNNYAAELAQVTVWIGEIQWMRKNGFDVSRNPILKPLRTIQCRDALLEGPLEAEWPSVDVIIGNPPFIGGKLLRRTLGDEYVDRLFQVFDQRIPSEADFVTYWFEKARMHLVEKKADAAGFVCTNSIRGAFNRRVLDRVVKDAPIFDAWSDEPWVLEGAAVRVSLICFGTTRRSLRLNGMQIGQINTDLSASEFDLSLARPLRENRGKCFQGPVKVGPFDIAGDEARALLTLPVNPNGQSNENVVKPWANGMDVVRRPLDKWIIDFGDMSEAQAALYEAPFRLVLERVKTQRLSNRDKQRRENWWRLGRSGLELKAATANLSRIILTPRVSKHRLFVWRPATTLPDSRVVAIARDDDLTFGILHSIYHEAWSLKLGGWHGVGNDPQYTPTTGFETFPFPDGMTPDLPPIASEAAQRIGEAARTIDQLRQNWLNPADLITTVPEVSPIYPDRIIARHEGAEAKLRERTLTKLYNDRPKWLDNAHRDLNAAVAAAYGWPETISIDDALARLLELNNARLNSEAVKEINSVPALKKYLAKTWPSSPARDLSLKLIDFLVSEPQSSSRLSFELVANIFGKEQIDDDFVKALNILSAGKFRSIEPRFSFELENLQMDLAPGDFARTADFEGYLAGIAGRQLSDADEHLFPFFVPSNLIYRLRLS
ncbi:class I SAM-dependent DNA methyltransferase [Rhizobium phaseoli]|uniref:class I SAM-dependent DNA methyltransferase n=1 Tax=Rhizobium phaseoli TaxID=396 RepID=UPI0007EC1EDA|nr:DNA methyltransferase [Rhizobium phaseoli]ANL38324.1 type II restriction enzyme methylase subunit protein [Rhizobium phaseoli]ANM02028.1 type II restriction enzyme methylase subunit protein [Rhizobium phaseoli]